MDCAGDVSGGVEDGGGREEGRKMAGRTSEVVRVDKLRHIKQRYTSPKYGR